MWLKIWLKYALHKANVISRFEIHRSYVEVIFYIQIDDKKKIQFHSLTACKFSMNVV